MKLQTSGVLGTSYAIAKLAPKRGKPESIIYNLKKYLDGDFENDTQNQCEILCSYLKKRMIIDNAFLNYKKINNIMLNNNSFFDIKIIQGNYNISFKTSYNNKYINILITRK